MRTRVFFEVGTKFLNIIYMKGVLQSFSLIILFYIICWGCLESMVQMGVKEIFWPNSRITEITPENMPQYRLILQILHEPNEQRTRVHSAEGYLFSHYDKPKHLFVVGFMTMVMMNF
jgi:Zn-dependent membrane protease YugP